MTEPRRATSRRVGAPSRTRGGNAAINRLHARVGDEAFFRHVVAGMRNGVLAITRQGVIALINDEAYRIFEIEPRADDVGRPFGEVLREHPDVVRVLSSVFEVSLLPNRAELRLKNSGKVIGYTIAHVHDDSGDVTGASMFFKDLTRVEQLEERERLRDRLAAVGEMAAAIAHEVKNPLAGIEVMAGLLRRKIPEAKDTQALLADIINEAKMANAIVQEVLDFVRPIRLQVERTSVGDAVHASMNLTDAETMRGATRLTLNVPPDLPHIQADQYQLTQLLTNLLTNAYEALGGQGHVTIGASLATLPGTPSSDEEARDAVLIEIADDGPGMPTEIADKIFDPFFTTKAQGSGLGLAIVRKIVDAHDGRIDLQTTVNGGTSIRVTLPVDVDTY
jgi:signal transduction histidine kinase